MKHRLAIGLIILAVLCVLGWVLHTVFSSLLHEQNAVVFVIDEVSVNISCISDNQEVETIPLPQRVADLYERTCAHAICDMAPMHVMWPELAERSCQSRITIDYLCRPEKENARTHMLGADAEPSMHQLIVDGNQRPRLQCQKKHY